MPVLWGQVCDDWIFSYPLVVVATRLIIVTFVVLVAVFATALATIFVLLVALLFVLHIFTPFFKIKQSPS